MRTRRRAAKSSPCRSTQTDTLRVHAYDIIYMHMHPHIYIHTYIHAEPPSNFSLSRTPQAPIGKKAFLPAKLEHTNELLVLLGDNYFVERSAKQTLAIIDRRLESVIKRGEDVRAPREEENTKRRRRE